MQSVYEHITLDVTGMNETDNFLIGEPTINQNISELDASFDGSSNHVNHEIRLFPGIFFDTLLQGFLFLTFFVKRSLSSLMDIPKFPFLSFSPRMTKSRICWDLPSMMARNRVLNPRMQRFCTWEYTLPMFSVRLPFWDNPYHPQSDRRFQIYARSVL